MYTGKEIAAIIGASGSILMIVLRYNLKSRALRLQEEMVRQMLASQRGTKVEKNDPARSRWKSFFAVLCFAQLVAAAVTLVWWVTTKSGTSAPASSSDEAFLLLIAAGMIIAFNSISSMSSE